MEVIVSTEARFHQTPDGAVWTRSPYVRQWWTRYLSVFEGVRVLARVHRVHAIAGEWGRVDGAGVSVLPIPAYVGPAQYAACYWRARRAIRLAVRDDDAVIMRVGSPIANVLAPALVRRGHPFALEVVGDPSDVFAPGVVAHPLRPLFRWWFRRSLARQCRQAHVVAYVTRGTLQRRYPNGRSEHAVSDVSIEPEALRPAPRCFEAPAGPTPIRVLFAGSLEQLYKGPDILIEALCRCRAAGLAITATVVGDGRQRPVLEQQARQAGVADLVAFRGEVSPGRAVRDEMDAADLFVMPSRTEGLPRALIEAMARGLPCLASNVGGIPELLASEDLVTPGDAAQLAATIAAVAADPSRMSAMAARNLEVAHEYTFAILHERRRAFLEQVRLETEAWQAARQRPIGPPVFPRPETLLRPRSDAAEAPRT